MQPKRRWPQQDDLTQRWERIRFHGLAVTYQRNSLSGAPPHSLEEVFPSLKCPSTPGLLQDEDYIRYLERFPAQIKDTCHCVCERADWIGTAVFVVRSLPSLAVASIRFSTPVASADCHSHFVVRMNGLVPHGSTCELPLPTFRFQLCLMRHKSIAQDATAKQLRTVDKCLTGLSGHAYYLQ